MNITTFSLNGNWLIRSDPGNVGLAEEWQNEPDVFLSDNQCQQIEIPMAWQHVLGEEYHYLAWYRKTITLPDDWKHSDTRIRFNAVATEITLWINSYKVGTHIGDYIPVEFDISEYILIDKSIEIVARVDETLGHITKGFHDMLSIHHGGIWDDVTLTGSGKAYARPNGIAVIANAETGEVCVTVELAEKSSNPTELQVQITETHGKVVAEQKRPSEVEDGCIQTSVSVTDPLRWSPDSPTLYAATIKLIDANGEIDNHVISFGFRTIETRGTQVLLNNQQIHIRGILHWGHEPKHLAPAPPPEQVKCEFEYLRRLGFNCVCLCMWYPPEYYFEIADETGMMIWQEHPVWHSPMNDELVPEYKRLFTEFMRRDRNHPSVIIVSSTCEHPCYNRKLAAWWWKTAHDELPNQFLQVQTSSFEWSNPDQTDLYDEHTYDNNNRWVTYLQDLQDKLAELQPKPFVMGETVLFTSWPDVKAILEQNSQSKLWSLPKYYQSAIEYEQYLVDKYGEDVLARFKQQADRHNLLGRKFQIEMFRRYPNHAGLVTNHISDVPGCTCGFMDALGNWRFQPEETNDWLCDAPLLLKTPGECRSFYAEEQVTCEILISNFSGRDINDKIVFTLDDEVHLSASVTCASGEIGGVHITLPMPHVAKPTRVPLHTSIGDISQNNWDLWVFPKPDFKIDGVYRLDGLPFDAADSEPDKLEKGYSRGFGLPAKSWVNRLPDPAKLLPTVMIWNHDSPVHDDARVIVTHKLTKSVRQFVEAGGNAIVLASKTSDSPPTQYEWLLGQCPLVIESDVLNQGESEWLVDLLGFDLTRTYARVMPVVGRDNENITPLIRLVYTHDQQEIQFFDQLHIKKLGNGGLIISSLDHHDPAGQWLLGCMIEYFLNKLNA